MNRLQNYIIKNLSILFLSIFSALFSIASIVFLIKLASYTAIIQLSIWEMTKLYIFVIPELLFFTLPITFFVASALTIFKLSNDNEIVVLFSLGIHPKFILWVLLKPALLLTALLFFNFFVIFPHAKVLSKNFISYKKSEAKFNLSASEFGHKFGDWLLYLGKKNTNGTYSEVFLFNKSDKEELLIKAKEAQIINENSILRLQLTDGEGYSYSKEKFTQIDFETMFINDTITSDLLKHQSTLEYWNPKEQWLMKKRQKKFTTNILLSLFPLLSLFLVAAISIIHVRHQKAKVYLYLFLGIAIYYGSTLGLIRYLDLYTIPTVTILWLIVTYTMYRKNIVARF